jgi:hypothetical protein
MEAGAKAGAWARAGAEELPIKAATTARINRHRTCLSVTLAEFARLWTGFCKLEHHRMTALLRPGAYRKPKTKVAASKERPATFANG